MPSFDHEILVELFRSRGELAAELLRSCAGISIDHARAELGSIDLSQVASTEYRADAVVILRDGRERPVAGIIVEVQRQVDRDKHLSWPVYVTALRAKLRCPVVLLVVAPERDTAVWARAPIGIGHPGFALQPLVLGFEDVPRIDDHAVARRLPELAVLSAIAHPELEVAAVAIEAIAALPEDQGRLYLDVIMTQLPDATRQLLEARMQGYEYQSEFARKYYHQGIAEGREQGREEGREQGREEGREVGLRAAVFALLCAKLEGLSSEQAAGIEAIHDPRVLTDLVTALGQARTAAEARAAVDRALVR